jgi:hypothetical protein
MSAAAVSARCSTAGRRSGTGAGDHVTVTDSHYPALRMAPHASSRRQWPRGQLHLLLPESPVVTGQGMT